MSLETEVSQKVPTSSGRVMGSEVRAPNQEDLIELIGNWEWLAIMAMVDGSDGQVDANLISARLGMTKDRAADALEAMISHNLLHRNEEGKLRTFQESVKLDEKTLPISDLLNSFVKVKTYLTSKLNSKDMFATFFMTASKSVIENKHAEIMKIKDDIENASKGKTDIEVYALDYSFTRLSKTRSELL